LAWIGGAFDIFDGKIARKYKLSNEFGVQLDSFADFLSFVLVPVFLVFQAVYDQNLSGSTLLLAAIISICYVISGLRRLIQFNINSDVGEVKKYFYDYTNNQSALLGEKVGFVAWSPDSKKIAYEFIDPVNGQNNISTANPDGTNYKNIFKTRLDNLIVEWPSKEKISLRQPPSGLAQGILYAINSATGDFNKILSDIYGLSIKWSPKADKILYSSTDDRGRNPKLTLSDETGANSKDLKLAGIADKCAWSKDDRTIFCALPQELSANAIWPDDYYKGLVILSDDFYKINLETGDKTKILGSSDQVSYDAQELFLSPKEDYLFFINKRDGLLYSLKTQ